MGMKWFRTDEQGHYFTKTNNYANFREDLRMRFYNPDISKAIFNASNDKYKKSLATVKVTFTQ